MQQCSSELVTNIILYINKILRTLLSYLILAAIRGFLCACGLNLNMWCLKTSAEDATKIGLLSAVGKLFIVLIFYHLFTLVLFN